MVSKKIFVFFMFCIILWLCCFNAFAESVTYELSNVGLTVDISDNIVYVSSSVKKNDELFKNNTFDYIETMAKIREDNALIYGRDSDNTYEIEIICVENSNHIKNLTNLSPQKQDKLLAEYSQQSDVVECSVYNSAELVFFKAMRTKNNNNERYFYCDYYTIYNKYDITFRVISSNDNLSDAEIQVGAAMANSVRYPEKAKLTLSSIKGKGVFVTFILICVAFVLVIAYRKNDEKVHAFIAIQIVKINKSKTATNVKHKEKDKRLSHNYDNSQLEDEDLSSIDLDEAIAAFDDSIKDK